MCKIVLNKLMLGNREVGFEFWTGRDVVEMTSGQIKSSLTSGKDCIKGLIIGSDGTLELDADGFYMKNIMLKTHVNRLVPMNGEEGSLANLFYYVLGRSEVEGKPHYEVVSSRFEHTRFSEEKIKALFDLQLIGGGATLNGDKIVVAGEEEVKTAEKEAEPKVTVKTAEKPEGKTETKVPKKNEGTVKA